MTGKLEIKAGFGLSNGFLSQSPLRLGEGINLTSFKERFGAKWYSDSLSALFKQGFLELSDNSLLLTKKGILVSNELIMRVCDSLVFD
jgi:coproporphyrinogen III oxidase-like Fe-S oxidoreductase